MKTLLIIFLLFLIPATSPSHAQSTIVGTALVSSARTAVQVNSADLSNSQWRGGQFIINISSYTSGNYTPKIQGKDSASGNYYDLLVGSVVSSVATTVLRLYPGIPVVANAAASDILPKTFRVQLNGVATPSMSISVSFSLAP